MASPSPGNVWRGAAAASWSWSWAAGDAEERYGSMVDRWSRATRGLTLEVHDRENARAAKEACEIVSNRHAR
jgi:hypothetical protein